MFLWDYSWALLCSWTPKPANRWRIFWLKTFGAKIIGRPFVHQRARIQIPWNLTLRHRATLGDRANAYSLGKIDIGENAVIAQEVYLCTGTHAFESSIMNLVTAPIVIGKNCFIGARTFVMPGVSVGDSTVIGACSVVTKNIAGHVVCAGNPCRVLKSMK